MKIKSMKHFRMSLILLIFIALIFQFSCTSLKLERNRHLWRSSGVKNYRMTVDLQKTGHATPMGKFIITVRGGVAESVTSATDPDFILSPRMFENYDTMEKIFKIIEREEWGFFKTFETEYDSKLGYPKRINIDDHNSLDDEFFFEVLQFEILE